MKQYMLLFAFLSCNFQLRAIVYGSNTTVSRQAAVTFPSVDTNNEMRGFGVFENGFTLANNSTTCLFNSYFPVAGTVNLNGGVLNLNLDLSFQNSVNIASAGTINGNGYSIVLPQVVGTLNFPSTTFTNNLILNGVKLILNSDVVFRVPVIFQGNCEIHGNGRALSIGNSLTIASGGNLRIKDVVVRGVSGTNILCASTTSSIIIQDSAWYLNGNYTLTNGSVSIDGNWFIFGPYTFRYASTQTSTVLTNSQIYIGYGSTFTYAPSSGNNLLALTDATSKIYLDGATLYATAVGLQLTNGSLFVDGTSYLISDGTTATNGIILGNGTASNDIAVKVLPGATLQCSGFIGYRNVN